MNAGPLHRLARVLREVAQAATANQGERPVAASTAAIVEDVTSHPRGPVLREELLDHVRQSGAPAPTSGPEPGQ